MPRLEGEKQSVLPYILGLAVVVALGTGAYFYIQNNQQNSDSRRTSIVGTDKILHPKTPGAKNQTGMNGADNVMSGNTVTDNIATDNAVTGNAVDNASGNSTGTGTTDNAATNSVSRPSPTMTVTGNAPAKPPTARNDAVTNSASNAATPKQAGNGY